MNASVQKLELNRSVMSKVLKSERSTRLQAGSYAVDSGVAFPTRPTFLEDEVVHVRTSDRALGLDIHAPFAGKAMFRTVTISHGGAGTTAVDRGVLVTENGMPVFQTNQSR